jgi:amino acid adenylation domain-containing protein
VTCDTTGISAQLGSRLATAARSHGNRAAVADGDRRLTYRELDERAAHVARLLVEAGLTTGDRIGIHLAKSLEAVVAIYGVLRAGACYVPIDPGSPLERVARIAGDCGLQAVVTDAPRWEQWQAPPLADRGLQYGLLVGPDTARLQMTSHHAMAGSATTEPLTPDSLAYILYTSGSTGTPKGVMLSHRNALAFVDWAVSEMGLCAEDRVASHAPLHFDLSIFDLFATATVGACVVLVPPATARFPVEMKRFIARERISVWYSVPSALALLVDRGSPNSSDLSSLRLVLCAGEVFAAKYLRELMLLVPSAVFWNLYGPTETNVCTAYRVPEPPQEEVPIGQPVAGAETLIVNEDGQPVGPGQTGELWVGGPSVTSGYWGDPRRTGERLVAHPLQSDRLMYRTGDLVAEGADGELRFLGRRDHQVKTRGHRVELAEIEAALHQHPDVVACAVIAVPDELVTNRLHAHVAVRNEVSQAALAAHLGARLPAYMVPERFVMWDDLPRTSTGKVDRQALRVDNE